MSPPINLDGDTVDAITMDGDSVGEVTVDGSTVFSTIPDDLLNQWVVENFASPWPDEIGNADMSVSGLSTATIDGETLVSGDGTDHGTAAADVLGNRETWGAAFTFHANSADVSDFDVFAGLFGASANDGLRFRVANADADVAWRAGDGSTIRVSGGTIANGSIVPVVVNKRGDNGSDFEIYVSDMSTDTSSVLADDGVDHNNWSLNTDWGFWASNEEGTITDNINAAMGAPEFKASPYSQNERESFVSRRPEV